MNYGDRGQGVFVGQIFLLAVVLIGFIVMVDFMEAWWKKRKGGKSGSVVSRNLTKGGERNERGK